MQGLRKVVRLFPRPARRAIVRMLDEHVPLRWQLPYVCAKLRLQGALDEEIAWLKRLMPGKGGVAIDIGANIGIYSYHLSRICDRVEAFDPNRACLRILEAYAARNINANCVALSAKPGIMTLNIPVVDGVQQTGLASANAVVAQVVTSFEVPTRTLDEYAFDDVRFIKIDVEGHEPNVLAGAEGTIRENQPIMLLEIEQRHQSKPIGSIFDAVSANGYRGFFVFKGVLQTIDTFDESFHQRGYLEKVQHVKYVNNFFFVPPRHELATAKLDASLATM